MCVDEIREGRIRIINLISTSHGLARELLNKPDGFITVTLDGKEYSIESTQRVSNCANIDDRIVYWTINLHNQNNKKCMGKR